MSILSRVLLVNLLCTVFTLDKRFSNPPRWRASSSSAATSRCACLHHLYLERESRAFPETDRCLHCDVQEWIYPADQGDCQALERRQGRRQDWSVSPASSPFCSRKSTSTSTHEATQGRAQAHRRNNGTHQEQQNKTLTPSPANRGRHLPARHLPAARALRAAQGHRGGRAERLRQAQRRIHRRDKHDAAQ